MNYFWAFVVGGGICVIGQLLIDLTGLTPARILTGYVVAGVILSAVGWYGPLLLFVGIPLPGTGAWTGTLAASILDMKFKDVLVACMGGVLLAGIIMGLASAGLLGALSGLFAV